MQEEVPEDIHDILPPPELSQYTWWPVCLLAVLILVGCLAYYYYYKKRKKQTIVASYPRKEALKRLSLLKKTYHKFPSNEVAEKVSHYIRAYLKEKWGDSSLFETDEEFFLRLQNHPHLQSVISKQIIDTLEDCSHRKYKSTTAAEKDLLPLIENAIAAICDHHQHEISPSR